MGGRDHADMGQVEVAQRRIRPGGEVPGELAHAGAAQGVPGEVQLRQPPEAAGR